MKYEAVELSELQLQVTCKEPKPDCLVVAETASLTGILDMALLRQALGPLLLSLFGLLLTSALLDAAQHWVVFIRVSELLLMIPVLLNLKGNLEMSVTGRLAAAIHHHNSNKDKDSNTNNSSSDNRVHWWTWAVPRNAAILTAQSAVCSVMVGALACAIGTIVIHRHLVVGMEGLLIVTAPIVATMLSGAINYVILVSVIGLGSRLGIDPDNVATPIASALGDFTSVAMLCMAALVLDGRWIVCLLVILMAIICFALALYSIRGDEDANELLLTGWIPIIVALAVTSVAGLVLERFYLAIPIIPILLPVVNGIAGGLVSVYACRLMTASTHKQDLSFNMPVTLLLLNLPIQLLFLLCMHTFKMGHGPVGGMVTSSIGYLMASYSQLSLMLYVTKPMVQICLQHGLDPATYALPILTAVSDLFGTVMLILVYSLLMITTNNNYK